MSKRSKVLCNLRAWGHIKTTLYWNDRFLSKLNQPPQGKKCQNLRWYLIYWPLSTVPEGEICTRSTGDGSRPQQRTILKSRQVDYFFLFSPYLGPNMFNAPFPFRGNKSSKGHGCLDYLSEQPWPWTFSVLSFWGQMKLVPCPVWSLLQV